VVELNLRKSFPELSDAELHKIVAKSYRNLADVLVEGLKTFTMTRKQIIARHKIINPEVANFYHNEGKSIIGVPCHYGNWEWGSISGGLQLLQSFVVMYKPFSNKWIDRFARWSRAKYESHLASIYETSSIFEKYHNKNSIFILAADQSPSNLKKAIWVNFLGQDTAFLQGPEVYAKKHNLPIIFVDIQRKKRGYYDVILDVITDKPRELPEGEITQLYARRLEAVIRKKPEDWLWSHRRWKHQRKNPIH